ncbi:MAG: NUDIX hydrolase [Humibacter sp.]
MDDARQAATVVITRAVGAETEVLLLRRSLDSPVFPGVWVFPGGVVSPSDREAEDPLRAAAVREASEECGLVVAPDDLRPLSEWMPPPQARSRFRTRFYRAAYVGGDVRTDDFEVVDHAWTTPEAALARHADGTWDLMPPTWVTLATLAAVHPDDTDRADEFHSYVVATDPTILAWAGDEDHPDRPGPTGARHRITLGPRPWVYQRDARGTATATDTKEPAV